MRLIGSLAVWMIGHSGERADARRERRRERRRQENLRRVRAAARLG